MQLRALGAFGLALSQVRRYSPEALESLCHTVRGDELDARRAPMPPPPPPRPALGGTGWQNEVLRSTYFGGAAWCTPTNDVPLCVRHRHAMSALHLFYACVRLQPATPWAPDAARRVLTAMLAAVRACPRPLRAPRVKSALA